MKTKLSIFLIAVLVVVYVAFVVNLILPAL